MAAVTFTSYGGNEKDVVRRGITAIREVLLGNDNGRKRSLLLALDWFMDPYYRQDISAIRDELKELLQTVAAASDDPDVREDALQLLYDYEAPPFPILEAHGIKLEEE